MAEYTAYASLNPPGEYVNNSPPVLLQVYELNNTINADNNATSAPMFKYSGSEIFPAYEILSFINTIVPPRIENGEIITKFNTLIWEGPEINGLLEPWELVAGLNMGMYKITDKMAILARIERSNNRILPLSTVIMKGYSNQVILNADEDGIICDYIPYDDYYTALIISQNYIVYNLIAKIDMGHFVFKYLIQKATLANATFRSLHRGFE
jgi:hypothetical protein